MKVLVVGANGFIAKNLIATLDNIILGKDKSYQLRKEIFLYKYSRSMGIELLHKFCKDCNFVFYLAGVNRPKKMEEFYEGNVGFLGRILKELEFWDNKCSIMYASSTQAEMNNEYGNSKKKGEQLLMKYSKEKNIPVYIYRLPNVFGKWSKPNYNSVVATFCHNIAREFPIRIDEPNKILKLVYIDDVVSELISLLNEKKEINNPMTIDKVYEITIKELAEMLYSFKTTRENKRIPNIKEKSFTHRLYSMYLTYTPKEQLKYPLIMNCDERGSFTELFKTEEKGQFSINITKPGITKGEHWHHTKHEKFIVVNGEGLIRLRKIDSDEIINFHVSGKELEVVDIPAGYTHNIINEGDDDLVTLMWANEEFSQEKPDTYYLKVEE